MFSATFSPEIRELAGGLLHNPVSVDVAPRNTAAETVTRRSDRDRPRTQEGTALPPVRHARLASGAGFARTKHGADALARTLDKAGIKSAAIHGDKSQGARTRAWRIQDGKLVALVATDIAARGIDIDALPYVINYELPNAGDYVHRIGRTGRAGMEGEAISLVCHDERAQLKDIEADQAQPGTRGDRRLRAIGHGGNSRARCKSAASAHAQNRRVGKPQPKTQTQKSGKTTGVTAATPHGQPPPLIKATLPGSGGVCRGPSKSSTVETISLTSYC